MAPNRGLFFSQCNALWSFSFSHMGSPMVRIIVTVVLVHTVSAGILDTLLSPRQGRATTPAELGAGIPWVPTDDKEIEQKLREVVALNLELVKRKREIDQIKQEMSDFEQEGNHQSENEKNLEENYEKNIEKNVEENIDENLEENVDEEMNEKETMRCKTKNMPLCALEMAIRTASIPFRDDNETRCYDELGCLELTKGWYHLIYRPFNVFPLPRDVVNTRFILHTRKNPSEGQVLSAQNDKTIRKSNFDVKKPTKLIIHGFIDTPLSNWVKEMRRELLKKADWNVITVDWAGGSLPLYTQATANTRLVGLELAYFLNYLVQHFGLEPSHVHMIGHSLGAHTAGYAGQKIPGIGRITGLDPAEPYFQGMPNYVRLDPSDAQFVDVIHTDGKSIFLLGYGMSQPCGHIDFYPNNGKEQPGCDIAENPVPLTLVKEGLEEASRVLLACNHVRAIKLFTDSINSKCQYMAHHCDSFEHYMQGRCSSCRDNSSECATMGLAAENNALTLPKPVGGKFFTTTGKEFPFCRKHYQVTLELARPPRAEDWVQGFMKISLLSDNAAARNIDLTPTGYVRLQHGHTRTFVVSHPAELGAVKTVEFYWEYDMDVLQPRSLCFFWCNDHLYVSRIQVLEMDAPQARGKRDNSDETPMVELCSASSRGYTDIASRSSAMFYDNC